MSPISLLVDPSFFRRFRGASQPPSQLTAAELPIQPPTIDLFGERLGRLRETFDLLEVDVIRLIGEVIHAGEAAHNDISELAKATRAISAGSAELAHGAEDAARDVRRLAAASSELTASGEEINRRLRDVSSLASNAKQATEEAHGSIAGLKTSSTEIGSIVGVINAIARQIDLVSLNAMIEASRAGDSGRGFAVVANEVKSLASTTQKATEDITRRVEQLRNNSTRLITAFERIGHLIEGLSPVIAAIAAAVETQTSMTSDLSRATEEASAFAADVGQSAQSIASSSTATATSAGSADSAIQRVMVDADKLRSRFTIFLRQTEMGNRRRHDRLPCDLGATLLKGSRKLSGRAVDISEGGMLVKTDEEAGIATRTDIDVSILGLGKSQACIVGRSAIGLHLQWLNPSADFSGTLEAVLGKIRGDHAELITAVIDTAGSIERAMESAIRNGLLSQESLFNTDYEYIDGSDPAQYRTPALPALETILTPIQDRVRESNPRTVFCVAVDRNAWMPVHNKEYSLPQRAGQHEWNVAHCRNRRIFDDRAGLAAARNIQPSLIQIYNRDLGGGHFALMKEVDAPIRVFGKHWGGLRVAYNR